MKISEKTLKVLSSYSQLNPSLKIDEGNIIATVNARLDKNGYGIPIRTITAVYQCEETFETPIRLLRLKQFLDSVSYLNNPDFELFENCIKIVDDNISIKLAYDIGVDDFIVSPRQTPEEIFNYEFDEVVGEFIMDSKMFYKLEKFSTVLQNEMFVIRGNNNKIILSVENEKDKSRQIQIEIDKPCREYEFKQVMSDIEVIKQDYKVILGILNDFPIIKLESLGDIEISYYIRSVVE